MKKLFSLPAALLLLCLLSACAGQAPVQPTAEPTVRQMDEAQLRQKLGEETALEEQMALYEELLARDAFTREDYEGLAQLYEKNGEEQLRRDTLLKLLLLYPSEDYARQLSAILADRSGSAGCGALAEEALGLLRGGDAPAVKALVLSEAWNQAFQDGLKAVEICSLYTGSQGVLQVRAAYRETELSFLEPDGAYFYFKTEPRGTVLAAAHYADGAFQGEAAVNFLDGEDQPLLGYTAVLEENLCTGELHVSYEGTEYTGSLNEDGTSAEKQESGVEGLVYARSGSSYLYLEGAAEDTVFDCAALGLPVYTPWETE